MVYKNGLRGFFLYIYYIVGEKARNERLGECHILGYATIL